MDETQGAKPAGWRRGMRGLAAGAMTAAAVWWMILPSLDRAVCMEEFAFAPGVVGIWLGFGFVKLPGGVCAKSFVLTGTAPLCLMADAVPWLLGFYAGVLLCAAVTKLIPQMKTPLETGGFALGFTLLLALDGMLA